MNENAWDIATQLASNPRLYRVAVSQYAGARIIDCGSRASGSIAAGLLYAAATLGGLAAVHLVPGDNGLSVQVQCDHPVRACLGSQYAGWQIKAAKYFAMCSGPIRAAAGFEHIIKDLALAEDAPCAVGMLESNTEPTEDVIAGMVERIPTVVEKLSLMYAPCQSLVGTVQVVARSLETALHKLHEVGFDVQQVLSGYGIAPLPPVADSEINAIGRTNDAILYGGHVTLWHTAEDDMIDTIGPKVPSSSSQDHGTSFAELFARYKDFYKIDPLLFSPAMVTFNSLKTGRSRTFGQYEPTILERSFRG
jgi:methenyltetrahydromethanopterin cyclohydrolase